MILRMIPLFCCAFFMAYPALAAEPLVFRDKAVNIREQSVLGYLAAQKVFQNDLPYRIAATDLNFDGVDEWIVRQDNMSGCEVAAACHFMVVGLSKNTPLLLGKFQASKFEIAEAEIYGVHILKIYNKPNNDFEFTQLRWNPKTSEFAE